MSDLSTFKLSLRDAVDMYKEIGQLGQENPISAVRALRDVIEHTYQLGYMAAKADAIKAEAEKAKRPDPFTMKEVAPGVHAITLDNPEDLFRLLDDIARYEETGELPFNDNANVIAKIKGEPPYFV